MMHKILPTALAMLLAATCIAPAVAQTAAFQSYTKPCGPYIPALDITGLPRLGSTFTVNGIRRTYGCTYQFCGCTVGFCKKCTGSALFVGASKAHLMLPGGCFLDISPDVFIAGTVQGTVPITVPNNGALAGVKFYLQRVDLTVQIWINTSCQRSYVPAFVRGASDAVEGTVGR